MSNVRLFENLSHNHATSTTKRHFMELTSNLTEPNGLFINEIFSLKNFIVTFLHCVTYKGVSHFSKSENI